MSRGRTQASASPRRISSPARDAWRRFARNKLSFVGGAIVLVILLAALLAPHIAPSSPVAISLREKYRRPSSEHWLGTDELGRDVLSRLIYGARVAVGVAFSAVLLAAVVGSIAGLIVSYSGGWIDEIAMRFLDIVLAFPAFLLAIVLVAFLGPNTMNIVLVIAVTRLPRYARLIRGQVISLKETVYVEAARAIGAGELRIALRHILPGCVGALAVYVSLTLGESILAIAGLSFLGIGIQPPTPDWGVMLTRGRDYLLLAPWVALAPGAAIFATVLGFNLLGDGLRDAFDPRGQ